MRLPCVFFGHKDVYTARYSGYCSKCRSNWIKVMPASEFRNYVDGYERVASVVRDAEHQREGGRL
jgi:acyl-CoA thioesterase FadM